MTVVVCMSSCLLDLDPEPAQLLRLHVARVPVLLAHAPLALHAQPLVLLVLGLALGSPAARGPPSSSPHELLLALPHAHAHDLQPLRVLHASLLPDARARPPVVLGPEA